MILAEPFRFSLRSVPNTADACMYKGKKAGVGELRKLEASKRPSVVRIPGLGKEA